jgi:hypothetical protein
LDGSTPLSANSWKPADDELEGQHVEHDRRDAEEAADVDAQRTADQEERERHRQRQPEPGADQGRQARELNEAAARKITVSMPSRRIMNSANRSTPQPAPPSRAEATSTLLSISRLRPLRRAVHPPHEREDEYGADQHERAFERLAVEVHALERDRARDRADHGEPDAGPDPGRERGAAGLLQVRQDDRDDERGFDAFAQDDDECFEHRVPDLWEPLGPAAGCGSGACPDTSPIETDSQLRPERSRLARRASLLG